MDMEDEIQVSLVEQIVESTFERLKGREQFDEKLLEGLRELAKEGALKKHARVAELLKSKSGDEE